MTTKLQENINDHKIELYKSCQASLEVLKDIVHESQYKYYPIIGELEELLNKIKS